MAIIRRRCPLCGAAFTYSTLYPHVGSVRCLDKVRTVGRFHEPEKAQKLMKAVSRVRKLLGFEGLVVSVPSVHAPVV